MLSECETGKLVEVESGYEGTVSKARGFYGRRASHCARERDALCPVPFACPKDVKGSERRPLVAQFKCLDEGISAYSGMEDSVQSTKCGRGSHSLGGGERVAVTGESVQLDHVLMLPQIR